MLFDYIGFSIVIQPGLIILHQHMIVEGTSQSSMYHLNIFYGLVTLFHIFVDMSVSLLLYN